MIKILKLKNMHNKYKIFFRKVYLFPYIIYSFITFLVWYKTKFDVTQFIPDFSFYFPYAFRFWGNYNSEFAIRLIDNIDGVLNRGIWQPAPLYPIVFLSPLNILGSKIIFAIEGYLVGLGCIFLVKKILSDFNYEINEKIKIYSLIFFSISPIMLTNTIALTTNGVFGLFLLIAAAYSRNFLIRTLSLVFASLVRPNFAILMPIFLICYFKGLIPRTKKIKLTFFFVFVSYIIIYLLYYKNYPGNVINYFLLSSGQGLGSFGEYGSEFLSRTLDLKVKLLESDINLQSIFYILRKPEGINYIIQLIFAKMNSLLGYNLEGLYETDSSSSFWFSKILRTIYYFFFLMPGFLISLKKSFSILKNKTSYQNRKINTFILSGFLYVFFSSMLIGAPRYLFPIEIVFIFISITFWTSSIRISNKVYL